MLNKPVSLFNSSSKFVKYGSILSFVVFLLSLMYTFLDPHIKEAIDGFILRILIYSKTQILFIFKVITKEFLAFFWGVVIMQFWYGFIFGGIKKFIFMSFSSKLLLLVLSLGKRYLIDNVIMVTVNNNFLHHIKRPISKLSQHYLELIKDFSPKKKIAIWAAAIGIPMVILAPVLYFVGLLTFILEKLFSANMWKAMLIWIMKILTVFLTFFSNIWDSWFAPIIEIVLFTWILGLLEKIPFLGKLIRPIYVYFNKIILRIQQFLNKHFHKNIKKGFGSALSKINYHVDITILKSQNEKMLTALDVKRRLALKNYVRNSMKTKKDYTYEKRLNSLLKSRNNHKIKILKLKGKKNK